MQGMECFRKVGAHFFESYEANMNKCYSYTRTLYVRAFLRYVIRWYIMVIFFFLIFIMAVGLSLIYFFLKTSQVSPIGLFVFF